MHNATLRMVSWALNPEYPDEFAIVPDPTGAECILVKYAGVTPYLDWVRIVEPGPRSVIFSNVLTPPVPGTSCTLTAAIREYEMVKDASTGNLVPGPYFGGLRSLDGGCIEFYSNVLSGEHAAIEHDARVIEGRCRATDTPFVLAVTRVGGRAGKVEACCPARVPAGALPLCECPARDVADSLTRTGRAQIWWKRTCNIMDNF